MNTLYLDVYWLLLGLANMAAIFYCGYRIGRARGIDRSKPKGNTPKRPYFSVTDHMDYWEDYQPMERRAK